MGVLKVRYPHVLEHFIPLRIIAVPAFAYVFILPIWRYDRIALSHRWVHRIICNCVLLEGFGRESLRHLEGVSQLVHCVDRLSFTH